MLSDAQLNFNRKMREIVDYGELLIIFALCEWDVVALQNKKKRNQIRLAAQCHTKYF